MKPNIERTVLFVGLLAALPVAAQPAPDPAAEPPAEPPPAPAADPEQPPPVAPEQPPPADDPPSVDAEASAVEPGAVAEPAPPSEEAPATESAEPSQDDGVSEADLLAELQEIEGGSAEALGVKLYGFMDFNYTHTFDVDPLLSLTDRSDSFFVGNANVYFAANVNRHLRSLLEVRFTYLPNGAPDEAGDFQRTSTPDYNDHDRDIALGSIEIERAHGDYEFAQELTVRFGQFLTPYGIWNVDHGSPTVISIGIPYAIGQGLIPERQTGFEFLGRYDLSDRTQLRYHLTLSNGRGPFESHLDLDDNKAVGGRVQLVLQPGFGDLSAGASTYYGRYTDAGARDIDTGERPIYVQYDELAIAGDLKWTFEGVHVQGELVHQQVAYTEEGRFRLRPDSANWGAYGLAGYRIPVIELMPFVKYERQDDELYDLWSWAVGLNYRPYPELVLKASGSLIHSEWAGSLEGETTRLDTQIAWAF